MPLGTINIDRFVFTCSETYTMLVFEMREGVLWASDLGTGPGLWQETVESQLPMGPILLYLRKKGHVLPPPHPQLLLYRVWSNMLKYEECHMVVDTVTETPGWMTQAVDTLSPSFKSTHGNDHGFQGINPNSPGDTLTFRLLEGGSLHSWESPRECVSSGEKRRRTGFPMGPGFWTIHRLSDAGKSKQKTSADGYFFPATYSVVLGAPVGYEVSFPMPLFFISCFVLTSFLFPW